MMDTKNLNGQRVAIYARYSSDNQRDASIDDQVRRCRSFVEAHGGAFDPDLVFADHAVSGASLQRPAFEKLMALVEARPRGVDVIVTEDLSRITRDFADGAMVFRKLQYLGVPLHGVADGIDTSARGAKMSFTLKNLLADMYLDELIDKTLRGMEGRALRGLSTGGLPFGYRSRAESDAHGVVVGHVIEVDDEQAPIVRRIFAEYRDGRSLAGIAGMLNAEAVPPPRAHTRHRRKGWVDSTVRAMLHNEKYVGEWTFKKRQWRKVPGTNIRRPRLRPEAEVMRQQREHLRIIPDEVWQAVQTRLHEVRTHYTKTADGRPKGRSAPGGSTPHLLSGLLICDRCGGVMVITGGNPARYYGCSEHHKRKTCQNRLSVRGDVAQRCILATLRARLASAEGIAYASQRIAELLGEARRTRGVELAERRGRLARTEDRIRGIINMMAEGDRSEYVASARRDLEAQAQQEKQAIVALERAATAPLRLSPPEEVMARVFDLEARLTQDVVRGREELRRLFKDGVIRLVPQGDHYVAQMGILPLTLLVPESTMPGPEGSPSRASYRGHCGGQI